MDNAPQARNGDRPLLATDRQSFVDSTVIPCVALLMSNIMTFSGAAAFAIRPNPEGRLAAMGGSIFLGVILGGLCYPRLSTWALQAGRSRRRFLLAAWLVAALVPVLPGLRQYVFNEPLRIVANLLLGLQIAPAYLLYFSRFPNKWRGTGFGVGLGAGMLCWNMFVSLANAYPAAPDVPFHPLLASVYCVHVFSIALFSVSCLYGLALFPREAPEPAPYFTPIADAAGSGGHIRIVISIAFVVYFLSGILDAKFVPVFPSFSSETFARIPAVLAIVAPPLVGRLLDQRLDFLLHRIVPIFCWALILAPALTVLGQSHSLYGVLQSFTTVGQFSFFMICSVLAAGLATSVDQAVWYSVCIFVVRATTVIVQVVWSQVFGVGKGPTVLVAVALAYLVSQLTKRLQFTIADRACRTSHDTMPEKAAETVDAAKSIAAFVDSGGLTPREREAATLLLEGHTLDSIAKIMGISARTVKKHTVSIYQKYNVGNRHGYYRCYTQYLLGSRENAEMTPDSDDPRK